MTPGNLIKLNKSANEHPFECLVLSGSELKTKREGRFVVDLDTARPRKERLAVDYDHNPYVIIGYAQNFLQAEEGLIADGAIVVDEKVRREFAELSNEEIPEGELREFISHLVTLLEHEVPLEASASLDLEAADRIDIPAGESVRVNGRDFVGPITVYRNAPITRIAACPNGVDHETRFTLLSMEMMMFKTLKAFKPQQTTDLSDSTPPEGGDKPKIKDPDLAEFIEVFGTEKGLELYQSGADIAEVRQLKELLDKYGPPGTDAAATELSKEDPPKEDPAPSPEPEKKEETPTNLSREISALRKDLTNLSRGVDAIKSAFPRGEQMPLHHGLEGAPKEEPKRPDSSLHRMAAKYAAAK